MPISFLRFAFQRLFQDSNAPFFLQIRTLAQDFVLTIFGEPVLRHLWRIAPFRRNEQPNAADQPRGALAASAATAELAFIRTHSSEFSIDNHLDIWIPPADARPVLLQVIAHFIAALPESCR